MRKLINSFLGWIFDYNVDEAGGCLRVIVALIVIGSLVVIFVLGVVILIGASSSKEQPYLFCPNGAQVHSTPDSQVIGKIVVEGTRITCTNGVSG